MYVKLNNNLDFSLSDIKRKITLPNRLTPELAELAGVIVGDGHIYYQGKCGRSVINRVYISGHLYEDNKYYKEHINNIFHKTFNLNLLFSHQRENEMFVKVHSKAITHFFKEVGVKTGRKSDHNYIPKKILMSNDKIKRRFLRGIFDTEASMCFKRDHNRIYRRPVISIVMKSRKISYQIYNLIRYFNIPIYIYKENPLDKRSNKRTTRYRMEIWNKVNLFKFLKIIGFKNPKHLTKIEIWRKFGFYPPYLFLLERNKILQGKINPVKYYKFI
ncbi:hypothetical protein CL617_00270 [archaeon]|nr:hypothetical protein [archaeon]|tara:strand:+ start:4512 stop:5330 length:819 start_codon:yes stop_codon:yes gene_type:complete